MSPSEELTEIFRTFPGVGPRQAKRFVYHLLTRPRAGVERIAALIKLLPSDMASCADCRRYFAKTGKSELCSICNSSHRDQTQLAVVCRDVDLEALEKSGTFKGRYFVLGGTVPILDETPEKRVRLTDLEKLVKHLAEKGLAEIILATNASPEGDHTADVVRKSLAVLSEKHDLKISTLGRGLSTGTEIEYADSDTIEHALKNRESK
jgi:recombination protein RecR